MRAYAIDIESLIIEISLLKLNSIIELLNHLAYKGLLRCAFSLPRALCCALAVPLILTSTLVLADAQDTVNVIAGLSRTMDDNFFRKATAPVSETITTSYATLSVNKQYSMQRLNFEYTIRNNAFQNFSTLDNVGNNYKGSWIWSLTPRLTGTVSMFRSEAQVAFIDASFDPAKKAPSLTSEVQNFLMDWAPQGGVHFLGGFTRTVSVNNSNFFQDRSNTTNAIDLGIKYEFPSGSAVSMMQHQRQGEFTNYDPVLPKTFSENETEAKFNWPVSARTSVNMRFGYIQREHDQTGGQDHSSRDYSGWVGNTSAMWSPTSKLKLTASAGSALSVYQAVDANYARTNTLSFTPSYACTPKILVSANASISERLIEGGLNQTETSENQSLGIDWTPRPYVSLGAKLQSTTRTSNAANRDFNGLLAILTANINF